MGDLFAPLHSYQHYRCVDTCSLDVPNPTPPLKEVHVSLHSIAVLEESVEAVSHLTDLQKSICNSLSLEKLMKEEIIKGNT